MNKKSIALLTVCSTLVLVVFGFTHSKHSQEATQSEAGSPVNLSDENETLTIGEALPLTNKPQGNNITPSAQPSAQVISQELDEASALSDASVYGDDPIVLPVEDVEQRLRALLSRDSVNGAQNENFYDLLKETRIAENYSELASLLSSVLLEELQNTVDIEQQQDLYHYLASFADDPSVEAHSFELLNGTDEQRRTAYYLLSNSSQVDSSLVLDTVTGDTDKDSAIAALQVVRKDYRPGEEAPGIAAVKNIYTSHPDPEVKAAALNIITFYAEDYGTGENRNIIETALREGSVEEKKAAVNAITIKQYVSEENKQELLSALNDKDSDKDLKEFIIGALTSYDLNSDEISQLSSSQKRSFLKIKQREGAIN